MCLDPTCHEGRGHAAIQLEPTIYVHGDLCVDEMLVEEAGHFWKCCQLCNRRVHADPGAFGVYAICVDCFNRYADADRDAPTSPLGAERDFRDGIVQRMGEGDIYVQPARRASSGEEP